MIRLSGRMFKWQRERREVEKRTAEWAERLSRALGTAGPTEAR
jgi:hypothetical protein